MSTDINFLCKCIKTSPIQCIINQSTYSNVITTYITFHNIISQFIILIHNFRKPKIYVYKISTSLDFLSERFLIERSNYLLLLFYKCIPTWYMHEKQSSKINFKIYILMTEKYSQSFETVSHQYSKYLVHILHFKYYILVSKIIF